MTEILLQGKTGITPAHIKLHFFVAVAQSAARLSSVATRSIRLRMQLTHPKGPHSDLVIQPLK